MHKNVKFFLLELLVLGFMGVITFIEVSNFSIFESSFTYIKTPASWFVGLSIAYAFSSLVQKGIFSIFSKKIKEDGREEGDFFEAFLVTLLMTSLITPYIKDAAIFFFSDFFIYFHVILLQSVIVLYLLFKIKGNYEISGKYFVTNELIVLFYTGIVLYFLV